MLLPDDHVEIKNTGRHGVVVYPSRILGHPDLAKFEDHDKIVLRPGDTRILYVYPGIQINIRRVNA